jgi:hypothetical protein
MIYEVWVSENGKQVISASTTSQKELCRAFQGFSTGGEWGGAAKQRRFPPARLDLGMQHDLDPLAGLHAVFQGVAGGLSHAQHDGARQVVQRRLPSAIWDQ